MTHSSLVCYVVVFLITNNKTYKWNYSNTAVCVYWIETGLACDEVMLYVLALGLGCVDVNCVAAKKIM